VNDLLTPDEVEDRLRRTLATRAAEMAPGDGAGWDLGGLVVAPTGVPGGDVGVGHIVLRARGRTHLATDWWNWKAPSGSYFALTRRRRS
jgi:hypothetical protein